MFCPSCGVESTNKTRFCKNCGANLSLSVNTVEVRVPPPPLAAMTGAIATFAGIGFVASLLMLIKMSSRSLDPALVLLSFVSCLSFVFLVTGVLSWQLGRLVTTYRETLKQTVDREKLEAGTAAPTVFPSRLPLPEAQDSMGSVTEHTTRTLSREPGAGSK